eukprot:TRINITY_DN2285_c0_g2_i1.p2 TRINITY_DN2285_c0_g2~~TRINITY_DN2285_c0_g2_i1.p2  ORF type:complete len:217 (-),score=96.28 TRINITY_DN2285_c0_g2_i1:39-638(-)
MADLEKLKKRKEELLKEIEEERAKKERIQAQCAEVAQEIDQIESRRKLLRKEATFDAKKLRLQQEVMAFQSKLSEETRVAEQLREQHTTLDEKEKLYKQQLQDELFEHSKKKDILEKEVSNIKNQLREETELRSKIIAERDNLAANVTFLKTYLGEETSHVDDLESSITAELQDLRQTATHFLHLQNIVSTQPSSSSSS